MCGILGRAKSHHPRALPKVSQSRKTDKNDIEDWQNCQSQVSLYQPPAIDLLHTGKPQTTRNSVRTAPCPSLASTLFLWDNPLAPMPPAHCHTANSHWQSEKNKIHDKDLHFSLHPSPFQYNKLIINKITRWRDNFPLHLPFTSLHLSSPGGEEWVKSGWRASPTLHLSECR